MCIFVLITFLLHTAIKTKLSSSILSTIKANGEWVWVYKDKIEEFTLLNNPWFIYKDKITDGAEEVISTDVIKILQAELNTNDLKNYVDNSIDQNMYIYLALFFLVSIYTVSLARWVLSLDRATKLHNRLSVDVGKNKSDEVVNVELVDEDILNT